MFVFVCVSVKTEPSFVWIMGEKGCDCVGCVRRWVDARLLVLFPQRLSLCEVCVFSECFTEWVASILRAMQGGVNAHQNVCEVVCVFMYKLL